jgi:hypothetical protein
MAFYRGSLMAPQQQQLPIARRRGGAPGMYTECRDSIARRIMYMCVVNVPHAAARNQLRALVSAMTIIYVDNRFERK